MYKQLFIVIFATRFVVCGLRYVELPDGQRVQITMPNGTLDLVSLKSVAQKIADKIDSKQGVEESYIMTMVADFLPTTITDLRLIQTMLAAADLQIGEIKSIQKKPREDAVIENIVTYYDYHFIYKNILDLFKCGREEKQITLYSHLQELSILSDFVCEKYTIHWTSPYHSTHPRENQDIEWLLKSKSHIDYFDTYSSKNYPNTLLLNLKPNNPTSICRSDEWGVIKSNKSTDDPVNKYPVLKTLALIIRAAELVKATDQESFIKQFTENLKSVEHPDIILHSVTSI